VPRDAYAREGGFRAALFVLCRTFPVIRPLYLGRMLLFVEAESDKKFSAASMA
jgi:hypothetical protein